VHDLARHAQTTRHHHGPKGNTSHKAKKHHHKDVPLISHDASNKAPDGAIDAPENSEKGKKMKGMAPQDVLTVILNIKLDNALVKLDDDRAVLPWLREPSLMKVQRDTIKMT